MPSIELNELSDYLKSLEIYTFICDCGRRMDIGMSKYDSFNKNWFCPDCKKKYDREAILEKINMVNQCKKCKFFDEYEEKQYNYCKSYKIGFVPENFNPKNKCKKYQPKILDD